MRYPTVLRRDVDQLPSEWKNEHARGVAVPRNQQSWNLEAGLLPGLSFFPADAAFNRRE